MRLSEVYTLHEKSELVKKVMDLLRDLLTERGGIIGEIRLQSRRGFLSLSEKGLHRVKYCTEYSKELDIWIDNPLLLTEEMIEDFDPDPNELRELLSRLKKGAESR